MTGADSARGSTAPTRALPGGRKTPLWQQVRDDLRARPERGEFTDSFPGEQELRAQYGVSRHTVREALRELRQEGLVTAPHRPATGRRRAHTGAAHCWSSATTPATSPTASAALRTPGFCSPRKTSSPTWPTTP